MTYIGLQSISVHNRTLDIRNILIMLKSLQTKHQPNPNK